MSDLARRIVREPEHHRFIAPTRYDVGEEFCVSPPGARVDERQYAFAGIGFVLSGWVEYHAQAGSAVAIPGAVVLANRGEYFSCRHTDSSGMRRLVVWFSDSFLEEVAQDCDLADAQMQAGVLPPGKSAARVFGWMRRLALQLPGREDTAYALAATALTAERAGLAPAQTSSRNQRRLRSVMRYIEASYAEPCSLKSLAALAGLSRYYFVRAFRVVAGVSPIQYLINFRLRAAADLLLTTKAPVAEIAFGVGFNDISHFNACFRAAFGCSPTILRAGS